MHPDLRPQDWLKEWGGAERAWWARALGRDGRGGAYMDSYRLRHPEEWVYTFWAQVTDDRARNYGYRIDYVLVSRTGWGGAVEGEGKGEGVGEQGIVDADVLLSALRTTRASDHAPVMVELALPPPNTAAAGASSGAEGKTDGGGGAARAHAVGCVKHKVAGTVVLAKLLPDPKQKSIRGFFTKKTAAASAAPTPAAAAAAVSEGNGDGEPLPKKAKTEAAGNSGGKGKGPGVGGGGGPMTKFFAKK